VKVEEPSQFFKPCRLECSLDQFEYFELLGMQVNS